MTRRALLIAVDGPAASGKGSIARALAGHYALPHLDTGLLYRAVGRAVLDARADPADPAAAQAACAFDDALLADPRLRTEETGAAASIVSALPPVRAALIVRQRAFAAQASGAVLDGRDIGTVIAPHANAKLFVTACPEVRAERRFRELAPGTTLAAVLTDIRDRDARDSGRSAAPLRQADDAVPLDTSDLDLRQAIDAAIRIVDRAWSGHA